MRSEGGGDVSKKDLRDRRSEMCFVYAKNELSAAEENNFMWPTLISYTYAYIMNWITKVKTSMGISFQNL